MTQRRAERHERLLRAAITLFAERGYAETPIDVLCAAARVSTRSFYEEFPSREAILGELHDRTNEQAVAAVRAALAEPAADFDARVLAALRAYFHAMTQDHALARVVLIEAVGVSRALEARRQAAVDQFAQLITAVASDLTATGTIPARDHGLTAVAIVGAVKELVTACAVRPRAVPVPDAVAEAARVVSAAFAPVPAEAP